ncbi:MAG: molybdopterin-dependent oxidoreductase [Tissierellia bacterium]|nr:molybdopterin-dependent oxidoreductase [Tissierellia bacterium]
MKEYKYVGKSIIRKDSLDRVTGETKYAEDLRRHNMLFGKYVLSDKAHAEVTFDFEEALKVEGVYKILTHDDIPKVTYNAMEWYSGIDGIKDEYIINDKARFVGDRIAVILGETKMAVEKASKLVKVFYEELPVVIGIEEAKKDEIIVKGETNFAAEINFNAGDYEEAFKEADYIITDRGTTPRTHHLAIEPYSALAEVDEFGNLLVSSGSQVVFAIQRNLSRILNIPFNKIRVIKTNLGGSFGGKQQALIELIAGYVSWSEKRPVVMYMDRPQSMVGVATRTSMDITVSTAVKNDGTILGRYVEIDADGGAYDTNNRTILAASAKKLYRLYKIHHQKVVGKAYNTNTIPSGATRAYGGPQSHAITEINITNAAERIGMDPCEFRLKNLVDYYAEDPSGGPNIGKAGIKECVEVGMEKFNWKEKYNHIREKNTDRYAYGVGVACASHGSGYLGAYPDFVNIEMDLSSHGDVLCKIGAHEQGCGTITTLEQMAAEALDLDISLVRVTEADTFISPYDSAGTQASRVTLVMGGALKEAGELLVEKLFETLNVVEKIEYKDMYTDNGKVRIKNSDKFYTYGEISILREKFMRDRTSVYISHKPKSNPAALAACFAEVKVDKKTGIVEIVNFLSAHDVGKSINPLLVEGQVEGGCQFSIGMAISEEIEIDSKGNVKNMTLSKYHVLNSQDMPDIDVVIVETEDETSTYGAKSVGEAVAVAPAPAVMNAINHALGTNMTVYPASPERIIETLQKME